MKYILDTNICIYLIKKKPESVVRRLSKLTPGEVAISVITWSELVYGVEKSLNRAQNWEALNDFISPLDILPWTSDEAQKAGELRATLEKVGKTISPFDVQIAAHALSLNSVLVTNNEKEFKRIQGLKVENWIK